MIALHPAMISAAISHDAKPLAPSLPRGRAWPPPMAAKVAKMDRALYGVSISSWDLGITRVLHPGDFFLTLLKK